MDVPIYRSCDFCDVCEGIHAIILQNEKSIICGACLQITKEALEEIGETLEELG